ncbi:MAG: HisA/HisF-related TIM barrel protein [Candidatus Thermoplasmatota archaeon]
MKLIPALSVRGGEAVSREGEGYAPLSMGGSATEILRALAAAHDTVLVLDLDAIEGREIQFRLLRQMSEEDCDLWLDAGIDGPNALYDPFIAGAVRIVLGTKRLTSLDAVVKIIELSEDVLPSLEFHDGMLLWGDAGHPDPHDLLSFMQEAGYKEVMVAELGAAPEISRNAAAAAAEMGFAVYVGGALNPFASELKAVAKIVSASRVLEGMDEGA